MIVFDTDLALLHYSYILLVLFPPVISRTPMNMLSILRNRSNNLKFTLKFSKSKKAR